MQQQPLPSSITSRLAQFERRRRWVLCWRGVAEALLVLGVGVLLVALLEWGFKPRLCWRVWLSVANYALAAGWLVCRAGAPWLKPWSLRRSAGAFEASAGGHFEERILSAVEMAEPLPPGVSPWMVARTIALAAQEIGMVEPAGLVDHGPARRAWKGAGGLLLALGLACLLPGFVPRAQLALYPYAPTAPLSKINLVVTPGNCRIKQGTPLEIKVTADAVLEQGKLLISWEDGFQESVLMSRGATNGLAVNLPAVSQGFGYLVQAGDAESPVFAVKVDVPPRIARMQLLIEPPAYAQWTNRVVEGGSADFLLGSRVRLRIETAGEKVAAADWLPEGFPPQELKAENNRWLLDLQPTNLFTYQLRLTGANKLEAESAQKWVLRPVPDEPPVARLEAAGTESGLVQRDEILALQAQASDDVGLKRVDLVALKREAEADVRNLFPAKTGSARTRLLSNREVRAALNYNLAELNLLTGDEAQLLVVATDVREQTTRSEPVSLTIGTPDKALEAQMAERLKQLLSAMGTQIDYLKQTRTSWLSIGRNYKEDEPNAQGPALVLLKSRLNEFGRELDQIGNELIGASETNNLSEARFLYQLGSTLAAWGGQQRQVLLDNCGRLERGAGANALDTFNQGRELFSRALTGLEQYQRVLAVLEGAFETDVLATRCESAQGRYKRGLPVLRGEGNVIAPLSATAAGLLGTFLEGIDLNGKTLEQKIDNPRFDNYAPANRREQWSCRYEGDINIPDSGDWTLGCVSDDGVRLIIDGKSVLPPEAWSAHAATQYKADLKLPSGWHPVVIEFFQGSSESKLRFLAAKTGQALQEVPLSWLRPPSARRPEAAVVANDPVLNSLIKDALKDRVKNSLALPATVPPALVPMTNVVQNENLGRLVREKLPLGQRLATNLAGFASWKSEDSQTAETQADGLTALSKEAQRILREELEKYRWRYEGSAALKEVQNAIQELRELNQELGQQPYNPTTKRTDQQQAKVSLARAWEKQLRQAAAQAERRFFETAKQKDATLAERTTALKAAVKADEELAPAIEQLGKTLEGERNRADLPGQVNERLNEITDRYRQLNEMQENINREQVAAEARRAFPAARAFARAQKAQDNAGLPAEFDKMKLGVAAVEKAERVAGDYQGALKLEALAGDAPQTAKGKETANELRDLALRTDSHPPTLAQTIPPPMQQQTEALEQQKVSAPESANQLARPRLAMTLEASRLFRQSDPRTAVAYDLLGEDLGALLEAPATLKATTLKPLTERAAALAGQKGEAARQAEISAANQRFKQLAANTPGDQEALAGRLDELSNLAKQAAGDSSKQQPLASQLGETARLAPASADWTESTNPKEIAAGAAEESLTGIQAAPKQWESYNDASQLLADGARQIRMDAAVRDLYELNPYPAPQLAAPNESGNTAQANSSSQGTGKWNGPAGQASIEPAPKGIDQAEWARLNERLRQAIRSSGIELFSAEQQAAIRAYFERLSSGNEKPSPSQ
jgi:hypothetical protein